MNNPFRISSPESLIRAIREYGILPFFKGRIPGWSVEELTDPDYWFTSSEELGPWDWKIDAVRDGDIAYGKFILGKAAFATSEFFRHLMNWRRSLPKYQSLAETGKAKGHLSKGELIQLHLSPVALKAIIQNGACDMAEIRTAIGKEVSPTLLRRVDEKFKSQLVPAIKKSVVDDVMQFLEMGTWTVIGDFTRIYRGPNMEYSGWQRSSHTTPELLFSPSQSGNEDEPFWARIIEDTTPGPTPLSADCSPSDSLSIVISQIMKASGCKDECLVRKILQ